MSPRISVIVPTFREAENLPALMSAIERVRREAALELDLLVVDDDSHDGTQEFFETLDQPWARLLVRRGRRGLGSAVLEGIRETTGEIVVVMDADMSHPPETIPGLVSALERGAEMAIGSRFVAGGEVAENRSALRRFASGCATMVVRPLTSARDPMSGFFAIRRSVLDRGAPLRPIGYKIGLEIMVKCDCRKIAEVPISFAERRCGASKLTVGVCAAYAVHVARLYSFAIARKIGLRS